MECIARTQRNQVHSVSSCMRKVRALPTPECFMMCRIEIWPVRAVRMLLSTSGYKIMQQLGVVVNECRVGRANWRSFCVGVLVDIGM